MQACTAVGVPEEEAKKLLARSKDQDVISKLDANTQEAFKSGVS